MQSTKTTPDTPELNQARSAQIALPSVDSPADARILGRMIVELMRADGRISPEEAAWLNDFLPGGAGTVLEFSQLPPLTPEELGSVSPGARSAMLMHVWTVALVDEELAPEEESLLARFAAGLRLSPEEAEGAGRNRRMILPLLRLGVDPHKNDELFRFLERCARIRGVSKIDHSTFITDFKHADDFLAYWGARGFGPHGEWITEQYPARHIALIRGRPAGFPWEEMVGLTVSNHPESPLLRVLPESWPDLYTKTHELQHIAINVLPSADMREIKRALEAEGIRFMTPVLSYDQPSGAGLRQMFTATKGTFFVEFAQRVPNAAGEPFGGFNIGIIDDLYAALAQADQIWEDVSESALRRHESWLPRRVNFDPAVA